MLNHNILWKPVVGFESEYEVSNEGTVRSNGVYREHHKGKIKATNKTPTSDYFYVKLSKDSKMWNRSVHRLVAEAFVPKPPNATMVNHKNGDKTDNRAENLEWVTCSENHRHAYKTGLRDARAQYNRFVGSKKRDTVSKFHNVCFDKSRGKWKGSLKHKGKILGQKRFDTEIEAALFVNYLINHFKLKDRPLNVVKTPND